MFIYIVILKVFYISNKHFIKRLLNNFITEILNNFIKRLLYNIK